MAYVANLMDIMLVFICGLMIAIIVFWNLDVEKIQQRIEDTYEDMGQVYQDPETGKMYVISSQPQEDAAGTTADGTEE